MTQETENATDAANQSLARLVSQEAALSCAKRVRPDSPRCEEQRRCECENVTEERIIPRSNIFDLRTTHDEHHPIVVHDR